MSTSIVVAGWLLVEAAERDEYLAACVSVVEQARLAQGCLDFSISADLLDPGRVNIYERWAGQADLTAFRGEGPSSDVASAVLEAEVQEFRAADLMADS
ncbi:putative quinol monooxygenase [Euzebya tangerina]|uniref:putative quinol monooxygenase n=1 Tax=Euzebya tangerina TaxID=591198 RepID=UPI00196A7CC2|nr:antibiotic biosynthesis monooxygenase family protein [Euzebya tangerina]